MQKLGWVLGLALMACDGDKVEPPPVEDGDADTDADADADTDTDTDADADSAPTGATAPTAPTAPTADSGPPLVGPIATAHYTLNSLIYWTLSGGSADTAFDSGQIDYFDARDIHLSAQFGFDAIQGEVREVIVDGQPMAPSYDMYLALPGWPLDLSQVSDYCVISIPMGQEVGPAPWVGGRIWWGMDYSGIEPAVTTCGTPGYELDPSLWGADVLDTFVNVYAPDTFGVGVGGPTATVVQAVQGTIDPQLLIGGQMYGLPALPSNTVAGEFEDIYGLAYEIDPVTGELVLDGNGNRIPIRATDLYPVP